MSTHKSACIMSILAVLLLNTACLAAEETTITASPTDGAAAPDGETGTTPVRVI